MRTKQHTPTPWMKVSHEDDEFIVVQKETYKPHFYNPVTEYMTEQNADFIVKACNNHDRLVEALDNLVSYMTEFVDVPESDIVFNEAKQLLTELKS